MANLLVHWLAQPLRHCRTTYSDGNQSCSLEIDSHCKRKQAMQRVLGTSQVAPLWQAPLSVQLISHEPDGSVLVCLGGGGERGAGVCWQVFQAARHFAMRHVLCMCSLLLYCSTVGLTLVSSGAQSSDGA